MSGQEELSVDREHPFQDYQEEVRGVIDYFAGLIVKIQNDSVLMKASIPSIFTEERAAWLQGEAAAANKILELITSTPLGYEDWTAALLDQPEYLETFRAQATE